MRRLPAEYREQLEALRKLYLQQLREKADAIQEGLAHLAARGFEQPAIDSLFQQAHRLAGSASIYRLETVSTSASQLESVLMELLEGRTKPSPESHERLSKLVLDLTEACARATEPARSKSVVRGVAKRPGAG